MEVHLIDGTYELFRHHSVLPSDVASDSRGAATRGVMRSVLDLIAAGATHVGVATDTVIESFRNDLWPGYKTGAGVDPALLAQFPLVEGALEALGVTVWAMREVEADDALATAAARAAEDPRVTRVLVCTPDKDLAQCVDGVVVQLDRRAGTVRDAAGVRERFGVGPESIPDYLGLVGDSADGFPGLPGWGAKSAAALLARYVHLEEIPDDEADWDVTVRGAARLAATLRAGREAAEHFRMLATLRRDVPGVLEDGVDAIAWRGPTDALERVCEEIGAPELPARARALGAERAAS